MKIEYRGTDYIDERGEIRDVLRVPIDCVTHITTKEGSIRGNHWHKEATVYVFVLRGKFRIVSRFNGRESDATAQPGDLVIFPPEDVHALVALEDSEFMLLAHGRRGGVYTVQESLV